MRTNILIIGLAVFVFSCGKDESAVEDAPELKDESSLTLTEAQVASMKVATGKITRRAMPKTLIVNGLLDVPPQNLVTISAPMGGFVKATELLQGMKVSKGQALVTLENQDYIQLQQDYLENKSKFDFLETEYQRQVELSEENVNSQKTLQQAKSQYLTMKGTVSGLEAKLKMIGIRSDAIFGGEIKSTVTLYAPITGFVTTVNVNIGQFVSPTDVMFNIVNVEHIHAELQIFEKDISKIKIGQRVNVRLVNEVDGRDATVYLIGKEIGQDRTVRVHCHFSKEDESLLPGMFVNAGVEIESTEVDVLPNEAVVNFEGVNYIFIETGQRVFRAVPITIGGSLDGYTELLVDEHFNRDENIVVQGASVLLSLLKNEEEE